MSAGDWFKFRIEILKEASLSNYVCLVLLRILAAACSTFGPKGPRVELDMYVDVMSGLYVLLAGIVTCNINHVPCTM